MRGRFWQVWPLVRHERGAPLPATAIAFALGLSSVLLVVAYQHFSEQRFSQAHDQASAAYTFCRDANPSADCETRADIVFEAAIRHRRLGAGAAAGGVVATLWLIVLGYATLDRIVRRRRS